MVAPSSLFERQPDRRSSRRPDSAGRRGAKRYVLENDEIASVDLKGQAGVAADVLDLSLTGAYLLLATENTPVVGQQVTVRFSGLSSDVPPAVEAKVMYVNSSFLYGDQLHGIGVQFIQQFSVSTLEESSDNVIYFAGKRLLVKS